MTNDEFEALKPKRVELPKIADGFEFVRWDSRAERGEWIQWTSGTIEHQMNGRADLHDGWYLIVRPIPKPLVYPPELFGLECAGISMSAFCSDKWVPWITRPHAGASSCVHGECGYALYSKGWPCLQHLSAQVAEQGIPWQKTWIAKPEISDDKSSAMSKAIGDILAFAGAYDTCQCEPIRVIAKRALKGECKTCGGNGKVWQDKFCCEVPCQDCKGGAK
jgi:hypothetical protein